MTVNMSKTYDLRDIRYWVYQPNLVRWRHRFRGVRESLKFNQEIGQYYFDINNARTKMEDVESTQRDNVDLVLDGGTVEDVSIMIDDATPSVEDMILPGFESLSGTFARIHNRIRSLERND